MVRGRYVNTADESGRAKILLEGVQKRLGMTPNMMNIMANSPAVLGGYLSFKTALADATLDAKFRVEVALAVAQADESEYCLACHTAVARLLGLSEAEIDASRRCSSKDAKLEVGLRFARTLVLCHGRISDQEIRSMRAAGYSDPQIIELGANVALEIFANYFNGVAWRESDFPRMSAAAGGRTEHRWRP
jgi:AhpD family alkylhydroperoxidase